MIEGQEKKYKHWVGFWITTSWLEGWWTVWLVKVFLTMPSLICYTLPLSKYYEWVIKITHSIVKRLHVPDHFFSSSLLHFIFYCSKSTQFYFSIFLFGDFYAIHEQYNSEIPSIFHRFVFFSLSIFWRVHVKYKCYLFMLYHAHFHHENTILNTGINC